LVDQGAVGKIRIRGVVRAVGHVGQTAGAGVVGACPVR
jgi:hypothetical protein